MIAAGIVTGRPRNLRLGSTAEYALGVTSERGCMQTTKGSGMQDSVEDYRASGIAKGLAVTDP